MPQDGDGSSDDDDVSYDDVSFGAAIQRVWVEVRPFQRTYNGHTFVRKFPLFTSSAAPPRRVRPRPTNGNALARCVKDAVDDTWDYASLRKMSRNDGLSIADELGKERTAWSAQTRGGEREA